METSIPQSDPSSTKVQSVVLQLAENYIQGHHHHPELVENYILEVDYLNQIWRLADDEDSYWLLFNIVLVEQPQTHHFSDDGANLACILESMQQSESSSTQDLILVLSEALESERLKFYRLDICLNLADLSPISITQTEIDLSPAQVSELQLVLDRAENSIFVETLPESDPIVQPSLLQTSTPEASIASNPPQPIDSFSNPPTEEKSTPHPKLAPHLKQAVHEFLSKFTIPDGVSLFQSISDAGYARLHELVENADSWCVTTSDDYVAAYELAEHHAIAYAFSQNPRSILAFADYYEFYQVTLTNECLSKLNQCKDKVQHLVEQNPTKVTQTEIDSTWQTASLEVLNQAYTDEDSARRGIFIAEVENSKHIENPKGINTAIQEDTERTYKLIAEKFGRRNAYGTREKLIFCSIDAALNDEDMRFMIQHHNRTNTLRFEFETTAVLQVSKFFNELPLEEQNIGKNYVDSYLRSAKHTIENPTESSTQELDLEGNRIFVFKRHLPAEHTFKIAEARVGVTKIYGRLTLLSYTVRQAQP